MNTVGHQFVLTIQLAKSYMQHAILLTEDNQSGETIASNYNWYALFQNYEIYIGDSSDWSQNTKCPGGPFMRYDDPNSFSVDPLYGETIWNFGRETWCNLKGQYTSIVADLSGLSAETNYDIKICQLGIMGTEYIRDPPLAESFTITQGTIGTFTVNHISSALPLGTILEPMLRQVIGTELSFVSFTASQDATTVTVDATNLEGGTSYVLQLESFNQLSSV